MTFALQPGPSGLGAWLSATCIVVGAPVFAAGFRAWRLRRSLAELVARPLEANSVGLVCVRGRVALDEPSLAPLSQRPCAAWILEVRGVQTRVGTVIERRHDFRLLGAGVEADVVASRGAWQLPLCEERRFEVGEPLPERVLDAVGGHAEVAWLRRLGVPLRVVERALFVGLEAHVVGVAHRRVVTPEVQQARTGTDGDAWFAPESESSTLVIEGREPLGETLVSAGPPELAAIEPPRWQMFGLLAGPALALFGLLQLALAALGGAR